MVMSKNNASKATDFMTIKVSKGRFSYQRAEHTVSCLFAEDKDKTNK